MATRRSIIVPNVTPPVVARTPVHKPVKTQPMVLGHEEQVDRLIDSKITIEGEEKVIASIRPSLEHAAVDLRKNLEEKGDFTKTVLVKGSSQNVSLSFSDAYAKIDVAVEGQLKQLLGPVYDELFVRCRSVSVWASAAERLLQMASTYAVSGISGAMLLSELTIDEYLKPVPEFRKKRFEMRSKLTPQQNDALDSVVSQVANRPSLGVK